MGFLQSPALKTALRAALPYVLVTVGALIAVWLDYGLGNAELGKPLSFLVHGDEAALAALHFKGMQDGVTYLDNVHLGAPAGLNLREYPGPDVVYFGLIRLAILLTGSWVGALVALQVLSFPMAGLAATWTMRRFGVSSIPAAAGGLLFAFLPFHHWRLFGHGLFAMTMYVVPIGAMLALAVLRRERLSMGLVLAAIFTGLTGHLYFTAFALIGLATATLTVALRARSAAAAARGAALVGVVVATFAAQITPFLLFARAHGHTPLSVRSPADSETFALKITQLLFPQTHHRFEALRVWKAGYDTTAPLVNENGTSYLGMVGIVGSVLLIGALIAGRARPRGARGIVADLAPLQLGALLFGTVGGLGTMLAYVGFPEVRSSNRISVCIGFYAFFALAAWVDPWFRGSRGLRRLALGATALAVTVFGVYETSFAGEPPYAAISASWEHDARFVRGVEAKLPPGAAVFQLPHVSFPESGRVVQLDDYAQVMPYLHAEKLRFSYGAMRGRRADDWNAATAALPAPAMAEALALAGFEAIFLNRRGYEDDGAQLERDLSAVLGPPIATSENGAISVFALGVFAAELGRTLSEAERAARADALVHVPYLGFYDGFAPPIPSLRPAPSHDPALGADGHAPIRVGAGRRGRFLIENSGPRTRRVTLEARVSTLEGPGTLVVSGPLFSERLAVAKEHEVLLRKTFELPPGEHWMTTACDAPRSLEQWRGQRMVVVFEETTLIVEALREASAR